MTSFSFKVVPKKVKRSTSTSTIYKIHTKVEGVVGIELNGDYYVLFDDVKYKIKETNFNCLNVETVYSTNLYTNQTRLVVIRDKEHRLECYNDTYYPFAPGSCVIGDVITISGRFGYIFDIKKVYRNPSNELAIKEYNNWKDNYETIKLNKVKIE